MLLRSVSIMAGILLSCLSVVAQNVYSNSKVPIASPTAASLGKFADFPVNYHTGIPEISIPIHTVEEGPLKLPVTLSYHAGGLKVMEQASWVGAGWALNAGGVITRSINGKPDEQRSTEATSTPVGYLHSKGYYSYLYNSTGELDYLNFARGYKDGEPDLFFFNFAGYTGKFYFRADNTPVLVPQQDMRIEPLFDNNGSGTDYLYGWILTTPDGVRYHFGKTLNVTTDVDAVEHTYPYSFSDGQSFSKVISSWYLHKIESPDKKFSISLTYATEEYSFYTVSLFPVPVPAAVENSSGISLIKNVMYGVRLSAIAFSNGTVSFIPESTARQDLSSHTGALTDYDNTSAKALKEIRISGGTFCKTFEFSYSYFASTQTLNSTYGGITGVESAYNVHSDKKRLKLESLTERSCDNTQAKPPHVFTYYDAASVPRTLSLGQDHWGYYNGQHQNAQMIPSLSLDGGWLFNEGRGANRDASWPAMRAGSLQKIQYPTGGYSEFEYGHHNVFVNRMNSTSSLLHSVSARGSTPPYTTSGVYTITVASTTAYLVRYKAFQGGSGTVYFGGQAYGSSNSDVWSETMVVMNPGTYQFYCSVSGQLASHQGVQGELMQLNRYFQMTNTIVGGLRVDKVTHNDGMTTKNLVTTYTYNNSDGVSQGVLYSRPNYIALLKNDRMKESGVNGVPPKASDGCVVVDSNNKRGYFISPSSVHPMQTTQGNHFGYNEVKVTPPDGGYTIYKYRPAQNNDSDICVRSIDQYVCDSSAPNFPPAPEPHNFLRGQLMSVGAYNAAGVLLKDSQYNTEFTTEEIGVNGILVKPFNTFLLATEYELKTAKMTKQTTLELLYNPQNPGQAPFGTISETVYNSSQHTFPTRTTVWEVNGGNTIPTAVKGKILEEDRNTYVGDITIPPCNATYTCDQNLTSALTQAMITYSSAKAVCGSDASCRLNAWWAYTSSVNNARMTYVNCRSNYTSTYNSCFAGAHGSAGVELKALLDLKYRFEIEDAIETSVWRDNKFISSTFTTYKDFDNDRTGIYPAGLEAIQTSVPLAAASYTSVSNTNSVIIKDSKYRSEETYRYKNGNIVEVIARNGVITAYLWGYNNTLPIVKAEGTSYDVLSAAYQSVGGDLTALRNHTSLAKTFIATFVYDPLAGMISQTDANRLKSTYGYDKLGRLIHIKDNDDNVLQRIDYRYKTN